MKEKLILKDVDGVEHVIVTLSLGFGVRKGDTKAVNILNLRFGDSPDVEKSYGFDELGIESK